MGIKKIKKEEVEYAKEIPSLTEYHYKQITQLYRLYGKKTWKLLTYWKAVKMGDDGRIEAIIDWSTANDRQMQQYTNFEPLKGIKYTGGGFLTYVPYWWCQEWLRQWEWWLTTKATDEEKKGIINTNKTWRKLPSNSLSSETKRTQTETPSDMSEH